MSKQLDEIKNDLKELKRAFSDRHKSYLALSGRKHAADAAHRAYLDLNKLCRKHNV